MSRDNPGHAQARTVIIFVADKKRRKNKQMNDGKIDTKKWSTTTQAEIIIKKHTVLFKPSFPTNQTAPTTSHRLSMKRLHQNSSTERTPIGYLLSQCKLQCVTGSCLVKSTSFFSVNLI